MTYAELASLQYGRSKSFADAQTEALSVYCQAEHDLKQLQAENAKLRELVRHLYTCMERQEPDGSLLCANCPYENESNECDYEQRMEELGVDA